MRHLTCNGMIDCQFSALSDSRPILSYHLILVLARPENILMSALFTYKLSSILKLVGCHQKQPKKGVISHFPIGIPSGDAWSPAFNKDRRFRIYVRHDISIDLLYLTTALFGLFSHFLNRTQVYKLHAKLYRVVCNSPDHENLIPHRCQYIDALSR